MEKFPSLMEYRLLSCKMGIIIPSPQSSYDDTVEVRNRFKGLDLIDRVPDELCMSVTYWFVKSVLSL